MAHPRAMLIAALAGAAALRAQTPNPHAAQPERPTVATHAYTIAPDYAELEFGLEFDQLDETHALQTPATLKLGLASHLQVEVTGSWQYLRDSATASGLSDLVIALKWRVADSLPVLGGFAIQPALRLPSGSAAVSAHAVVGSLLFISSTHYGPVEVDINFGVFERLAASSSVPPLSALWTVSAGSAVRGPLGWTLEIYGYPGTSGAAGAAPLVGLLTGPTYIVRDWFVIDGGIIVPISGAQPHAIYVGMTWNMGRVWGAPPTSTSPSR